MSDKTAIEWTDATWNPVVGCSIVSPGCTNCYAMKTAAALERRFGSAKYAGLTRRVNGNDVWTGEVRLDEGALDQPLRWRRPRRIFVNSMSDLFHESLEWHQIGAVFEVMRDARQHTFQVLTKRADRMREFIARCEQGKEIATWLAPWPLPNVWLGVSVEDQARADERIPLLLQTPAAVRFISAEPLLGPVDLDRWLWRPLAASEADGYALNDAPGAEHVERRGALHLVIAGGESGPGARPMHPAWVRSLRDQCVAAGCAFFMKQWGEHWPAELVEIGPDGEVWRTSPDGVNRWSLTAAPARPPVIFERVGKKRAGRLLDGRTWDQMPR